MKKSSFVTILSSMFILASCNLQSVSSSSSNSSVTDESSLSSSEEITSSSEENSSNSSSMDSEDSTDDNEDETIDFTLPDVTNSSEYDSTKDIVIDLTNKTVTNNNGYVVFEEKALFIMAGGSYSLSGNFDGRIVVSPKNINEEAEVELNLTGVDISSDSYCPLLGYGLGELSISAKKGSENKISDNRTSEGSYNAAIYSDCDLEIKGKGKLNVVSSLNNGIHTKDDLEIKNLTLNVTAVNNAIKGNDSLTIENATIKAISSSGDALKTKNSDISSKGKQRGTISINGGSLDLYAATDGIDASYDVEISGDPTINIYTDSYSEYSNYVSDVSSSTFYLKFDNQVTSATISANLSDGTSEVLSPKSKTNDRNKTYLSFEMPSNTVSFKVTAVIYGSTYETDTMSVNSNYDCLAISVRNGNITTNFTTYSVSQGPGQGGPGGWGGNDGNQNKSDYSSKGIKSDNEIKISGGNITIKAHDDAIHANSDVTLENGANGLGNVAVVGGNLSLISDDDGIHADNKLDVTGGTIKVLESYEGLEGNVITIDGGISEIKSSDDGINATENSETAYIYFKSGTLYINADGDGIDSNGYISMSGGNVIALGPSNGGNGVLDFDKTFTMSGGNLLAAGASGMDQKPTLSNGVSGGTKSRSNVSNQYITLSVDSTIVLELYASKSNINYVVYAGFGSSSSINVSSTSSFSGEAYTVASQE